MTIKEIQDGLIVLSYRAPPESDFRALMCAVQELERYERLLDITRWILVSERLPDAETLCLVATLDRFRETALFEDDQFWNNNAAIKVTHWMPLPEPPGYDRRKDEAK